MLPKLLVGKNERNRERGARLARNWPYAEGSESYHGVLGHIAVSTRPSKDLDYQKRGTYSQRESPSGNSPYLPNSTASCQCTRPLVGSYGASLDSLVKKPQPIEVD